MDNRKSGFSLVEVVIAIAIIGIIATIAVPRWAQYRSLAEERVCITNLKTLERLYIDFLLDSEHDINVLNQFFVENFNTVCPTGGLISFKEAKVMCSVHKDTNGANKDEPPHDEVPWL